MSDSHSRFLEAALAYAGRGWPVFPLTPGSKVPLKGTHGFAEASAEPDQIRCWWARWPRANIGFPPGAAGLLAIDLDVKGGVDGLEAWRALKAQHGFDDHTLASRTPSGGRHLLFARAAGSTWRISNRALGPGMDVRGDGGYILLAPSEIRGGSGGLYAWEPGAGPGDRAPALAPPLLVALLAARQCVAPQPGSGPPSTPADPPPAPGDSAYGQAALQSELEALAATPKGGRNERLNRAAFALGQLIAGGHLDRGQVESALVATARQIGLGAREVQATLRSGLEAGAKAPRACPGANRQPAAAPRASPLGPAAPQSSSPGRETRSARSPQHPQPGAKAPPGEPPECPPLPPAGQLPPAMGAGACCWLDEYIAFSRKWSPRSFDGFHEACGLWLLSTIAARRVMVHFGRPRFTNLSIQFAGRTTLFAKSSAAEIAISLLRACGLQYLLAPDESTPQSFLRALAGGDLPPDYDQMGSEQQALARLRLGFCGQRGWFAEEFGSRLASIMRVDGVMAEFRGLLRHLDDCPIDYRRSTIARGIEVAVRPYLAMLGILTPADLRPMARKGTQLWGDGFLARFAFVTPPHDEVLTARFPRGERVIPASLSEPLVQWHQALGLPRVTVRDHRDRDGKLTGDKIVDIEATEPQACDLTAEAENALYRYNKALLQVTAENEQHDLDGNYGRFHEKALRVAALLASLENGGRIELGHWARAQEIAERWRLYTHRLYDQVTQPPASAAAEIEDKILEVVKRWQRTEKYPEGLTASEIGRYIRGLGRAEIQHHAEGLVRVGALFKRKPGTVDRYLIAAPEPGAGASSEKPKP